MKVRELFEAERDPSLVLRAIDKFNRDEFHPSELDLGNEGLVKVPMPVRNMVNANFFVYNNQLTTFENFPEKAYFIDASDNKFKSLHNIHKYIHSITGGNGLDLIGNPIKSHVLGLLLIDGLKEVFLAPTGRRIILSRVQKIINKYLPNNRGNDGVLDCQNELIDAGLEEYAQL